MSTELKMTLLLWEGLLKTLVLGPFPLSPPHLVTLSGNGLDFAKQAVRRDVWPQPGGG